MRSKTCCNMSNVAQCVSACYNGSVALIVLSDKLVHSAITKATALVQYAKQRVSEQSIVGIDIWIHKMHRQTHTHTHSMLIFLHLCKLLLVWVYVTNTHLVVWLFLCRQTQDRFMLKTHAHTRLQACANTHIHTHRQLEASLHFKRSQSKWPWESRSVFTF